MARKLRIPKPIERRLSDLDSHLWILREQLHALHEEDARLKVLSAELRVLVCHSDRTDGLLFRLCKELGVSDELSVQAAGGVDKDDPINRGLQFHITPLSRAGFGHPALPVTKMSFEEIITMHEAVYIGGEGLTHDYLIKAISQQMGSAHEDEGIDIPIARLDEFLMNGMQPYVLILATDADLALEIGERVLEEAERTGVFKRSSRGDAYGNVSIVIRLGLREHIVGRVPVFQFQSQIASVTIAVLLAPRSLIFTLTKHSVTVCEIECPYPPNWSFRTDAVFVLSYCSHSQMARVMRAPENFILEAACPAGWLHANELATEKIGEQYSNLRYIQFVLTYQKLLSSIDLKRISDLTLGDDGQWRSPNGRSPWPTESEAKSRGIFPE